MFLALVQHGDRQRVPRLTRRSVNGVQNKPATVAGVGNGDCGYVSFIARFSKEGKAASDKALWAGGRVHKHSK